MIGRFQSSLSRMRTRMAYAFSTADSGNLPGPASVPGLLFWLDSATLTAADGATLTTWADSSGNGHTMSGIGGTTVVKRNIINGRPVARFNGSTMASNNVAPSLSALTAFVVVAYRASPANILFDQGESGFSLEHTGGLRPRFYIGNAGGAIGTSDETVNVPRIHTLRASGGQLTHSINQVDGASVSFSGNTGTQALNLGSRGGSYAAPADVAEFLIYNGDIGAANRAWVEGYLRGKYAI